METTNDAIADVLDQLAVWQEVDGASPFRVIAYRNAAESVRDHDASVADMVAAGEPVTDLDGVGKGIASKIEEIVGAGPATFLARFQAEVGPGLFELLRIPGLGPKRVRVLRDELGVRSPEELEAAAIDGRVRALDGFGAKTEERLLRRVRTALGGSGEGSEEPNPGEGDPGRGGAGG